MFSSKSLVTDRIVSVLRTLLLVAISNPLRLLATEYTAFDHFLGDVVVVRRLLGDTSASVICR